MCQAQRKENKKDVTGKKEPEKVLLKDDSIPEVPPYVTRYMASETPAPVRAKAPGEINLTALAQQAAMHQNFGAGN